MQQLKDAAPELIKEVQEHLIELRLLRGEPTGEANEETLKAWARFKRTKHQMGLDVIGPASLQMLRQAAAGEAKEHTLSLDILQQGFKRRPTDKQYEDMLDCMEIYHISNRRRLTHFLAQVAHESGGLRWTKELASGDAYEGRKDLGNTRPGDGRRFKGAGALQLTGRYNYQLFADAMQDKRIMEGVDYVAEKYFFSSAGFWWERNRMNALCDQGVSVNIITRRVNGGLNGLKERVAYYHVFNDLLRDWVL